MSLKATSTNKRARPSQQSDGGSGGDAITRASVNEFADRLDGFANREDQRLSRLRRAGELGPTSVAVVDPTIRSFRKIATLLREFAATGKQPTWT